MTGGFDSTWTKEVLEEVLRRSEEGQGIVIALEEMGLDPGKGLDWLQKYHMGRVVAAKQKQIANRDAG